MGEEVKCREQVTLHSVDNHHGPQWCHQRRFWPQSCAAQHWSCLEASPPAPDALHIRGPGQLGKGGSFEKSLQHSGWMTNPLKATAPRASAEQKNLHKARISLIIQPSGAIGNDRCETRRASTGGLLNTVQLTSTAAALRGEEHWRFLSNA